MSAPAREPRAPRAGAGPRDDAAAGPAAIPSTARVSSAGTTLQPGQSARTVAVIAGAIEASREALRAGDLRRARVEVCSAQNWLAALARGGPDAGDASAGRGARLAVLATELAAFRGQVEDRLLACRTRLAVNHSRGRLAGTFGAKEGPGGGWVDCQG
jgi:hypothetical protein